ncbi:MAG: hypothetical protein JWN76_2155 [Chitinophagaceae bacterium]|nr:hypothetical protein [Chitinophagaceae bacterium]
MNLITSPWPLWRRIIFRFCFILLVFFTFSWWLSFIPATYKMIEPYFLFTDWMVNYANKHLFHLRPVLVPLNGSGDTSYGWVQLYLYLLLSVAGCIIWSVTDRKRKSYNKLNYWLVLSTRYFVAMIAFIYGIEKVFALQMSQPNLSQLATPLGDFLPMRFSWLFIGYSTPYQVFSGVMEMIAGLLLLWRRTATLGALMATGVFLNVMMLNLSYDIPVKIFSMQMVFVCFFLLANEYERIVCFFILNRPAPACTVYHYTYPRKWMRIGRVVLKLAFIVLAFGMQFYDMNKYYKQVHSATEVKPIKPGLYDVAVFTHGKDSVAFAPGDTLRWRDVVFDLGGSGSVKSSDTLFRQRYHRGYFYYSADTVKHILNFKKSAADSVAYLSLAYEMPDAQTIKLKGMYKTEPLYVELRKTNHRFQLAEHQFHWLSEYNR